MRMRTVVDELKRVLVGTAGVFGALKRGWSSLVTPYRVDHSFSMELDQAYEHYIVRD